MSQPEPTQAAVHDFWNTESCGETLGVPEISREGYLAHCRWRYAADPVIMGFAEFDRYQGQKVLEIGVGLGSDHQKLAEAGADLCGIDLTARAVEHTRRRLALFGLRSELQEADAEELPFPDDSFDMVYAYGVLHHTPDTPKAVREVLRVLKPGGEAKVMIYHKYSIVGFSLWFRYALLRLKPCLSLSYIYAHYLESPGTKAYSVREARELFSGFSSCDIGTVLGPGDLLESHVGQRHQGLALKLAKRFWPRWLIRHVVPRLGLCMLIVARK